MKLKKSVGKRLHILEIALLLGIAVCLGSGAAALRVQSNLADKIVRLHVIANSDSPADQALKLEVRDTILGAATDLLVETTERKEAEILLSGNLSELERLAEHEVCIRGFDYDVTAELVCTEFPTREYDGFTLPAGKYLALRILIGEGAGQNWWCVVFPPLCTSAAVEVPAAALNAGFLQEEVSLICEESGYILKFKTVEFWEKLRQKFA